MHRWKFSALASALSLCTAFMASPAAALSLGAIHVQSHLGEPLRAEIDITQITAAEAGSLQATLASPDVFQAHGMELSPTARNVRVELISPAKGGSKIRLTTTSPVNDPFIDLILQANWSAGNLTRGYTLLLDPPPVQNPPAPTTAVQASTPAQTGQTYRSQPRTAAPSASSTAAATGTTDATSSVTVRTGDTAGRIAAAHAISGISLDQMLVAMLRNNPSAFINGNINRIKAGAVVSIPNAEQAQSTSAKEARQIIATQSKDFNAYRRKLAERTTQAQVGEAERSASGKVQAQVEDATAATTPTDKLTLSKGAAASKVEDKLMAEKQSTAQNDRTKELERNLAELEKLSDASAATTAAGSVAASAETAMPPTPGDNATAGDAPASPLTIEANAPVLPTDAGQPAPADPAPASTAAAAPDTPAIKAWLSLVGMPKYQAAVAHTTIAKSAAHSATTASSVFPPKSTIFAIVWATFALTAVIAKTPKKLNTAAIKMALRGVILRVETQVAIAFGASVHPFTKTTPNVKITVTAIAGLVSSN